MADSDPKTALRIAAISAATSVATALITAGVTVYSSSKQASKSAEDAAAQAQRAQMSATDAQSRAEAFVPSGAVMFIKGLCPRGWTPFSEGSGRFVIGTGSGFTLGEVGGSAEMPHTFIGVFATANDSGTISDSRSRAMAIPSSLLLHTRASLPKADEPLKKVQLLQLPPFVSLTMCLKP